MICSQPFQRDYYGWEFDVRCDGATIWCLLQGGAKWLLITEFRRSVADRLLARHHADAHRKVVELVRSSLALDKRFAAVTLSTKREFENSRSVDRESH
jgi:hypothetical protein